MRPNGKDLRFEIELKKALTKKFQSYLFINQFEIFEKFLTKHFSNQATRLFDLENLYYDWLLTNFRQMKTPVEQKVLIHYFPLSY